MSTTISSTELLAVLGLQKRTFRDWYSSEEGRHFLDATERGRLMFTWEALYNDGQIFRQYDDITFSRTMTDEQFIPPSDALISTSALDKSKVERFTLLPIAFTCKHAPWFQRPIETQVRLSKGERFICHWLVDFVKPGDFLLYRYVIGVCREISSETVSTVTVISPSGIITVGADENKSFEGE